MTPGTLVAMSDRLKADLLASGSSGHVAEFGTATGVVIGLTDYGPPGGPQDPDLLGPEVDVRWMPSGLRYAYHPTNLRIVSLIIAIDGPAASGKGTLAKMIAAHYGLACLDTGLLYRAVARDVLARDASLEDEQVAVAVARTLDPSTLDDPTLRLVDIGDAASIVARMKGVRSALLSFQRDFAAQEPGAVLDGRDIGTVVCPDAPAKLFVTADVEVRARRRYEEQRGRGEPVTYDVVLDVIRRRDERDTGRPDSPMKVAADAMLLDTTDLDIQAAFDAAVGLIKRKIGR